MTDAESMMFSINTLVTICRCSALVFSSSRELTRSGSSSKLKSLDVSISLSTTFCSVDLR